MTYIDGFVVPVPKDNRDAYLKMARNAAKIFIQHGALRVVEGWGDEIPPGKINDLRTAVLAEDNEEVLFSWIEWPSKAARDLGMEAALNDPELESAEDAPFVNRRMIYGGFVSLIDERAKPSI